MKYTSVLSASRWCAVLASVLLASSNAPAANLYWDGGTTSITTNGDGVSTFASGTWSTAITNWDAGSGLPHTNWVNANLDNAIFDGIYSTGTKTVTLGTAITVNQVIINTGTNVSGGANYTIGAPASPALTFGGTYSDSTPAIDTSAGTFSPTITAHITGTLNGGLVIKDGNNITTPGNTGRVYLNQSATNDFVGDITILSGNLHALSSLGSPNNNIILKGGALFGSSGANITYSIARNINVVTNSAIGMNSSGTSYEIMDLATNGHAITGSGNLTRYNAVGVGPISTNELRLSGDMSGYTGTITNTGSSAATSILTIQTTATSAGGWVVTGGTLKLNAADDTHIANGPGKPNLEIDGGALNMNGKSETINGLTGTTGGFVENDASNTMSTLTLGDADATASFAGGIRNSSGSGGTLALTKIGNGTQTFNGNCSFTAPTSIGGGTLLINGNFASAATVSNSATLGGVGTLSSNVTVQAGGTLAPGTNLVGTLTINNNLSLAGNLFIKVDKSQLVQSNDFVTVTGALNNSGTGTVTLSNLNANPSFAFSAGDKFTLFSQPLAGGSAMTISPASPGAGLAWTNNLAVDGSIGVYAASGVNTTPTKINFSMSGSTLTLSWPADHLGWHLQVQTNTLGTGLNAGGWVTLPGTDLVTQTNISFNKTNPAVFYRMTYP
jgi:autotransporter-associated beta strand protein